MARRQAAQNKIVIHDNISDSDITFFYRMPTTRERQDYHNMAIRRKGNKIEFNQTEARLKFGMTILTGIGEGSFEREDGGNYYLVSSDEKSPGYYPEWKQFVEDNGADLVTLLAAHVFEGSANLLAAEDIEGK
jgi:hypothetical protein